VATHDAIPVLDTRMPLVARTSASRREEPFVPLAVFLLVPLLLAFALGAMPVQAHVAPASLGGAPTTDVR